MARQLQCMMDNCGKCGKKSLVLIDAEEEFEHIVEGARLFMWQCMECENKNEMPVTITAGTKY